MCCLHLSSIKKTRKIIYLPTHSEQFEVALQQTNIFLSMALFGKLSFSQPKYIVHTFIVYLYFSAQ